LICNLTIALTFLAMWRAPSYGAQQAAPGARITHADPAGG